MSRPDLLCDMKDDCKGNVRTLADAIEEEEVLSPRIYVAAKKKHGNNKSLRLMALVLSSSLRCE